MNEEMKKAMFEGFLEGFMEAFSDYLKANPIIINEGFEEEEE